MTHGPTSAWMTGLKSGGNRGNQVTVHILLFSPGFCGKSRPPVSAASAFTKAFCPTGLPVVSDSLSRATYSST
jgi:hypothetical protein